MADKSLVHYNADGDQLEVFLKQHPNAYSGDFIDHGLTLLRDLETKEIVGYEVTGVIKKWPKAILETVKQMEANATPDAEHVKMLRYFAEVGFGNVLLPEERPWGSYRVLEHSDKYKVKLITMKPNSRMSLQRHAKRAELWRPIEGTGTVSMGYIVDQLTEYDCSFLTNKESPSGVGNFTVIPQGMWHRVKSGPQGLTFIEIQTGNYFGEDDIERADDDYGRISEK